MELIITLCIMLLYAAVGAVLAGIFRRLADPRDQDDVDDFLAIFILLWPLLMVIKPLRALYGWVGGR